MIGKIHSIVTLILLVNLASATTYLNIYLDETGKAEFLGETDASILNLPIGVSLSDGKIIGSTSNLTNKQGDVWTFSYTLSDSEINLILPKGAVIKNVSNAQIYLDNNQFSIFSKNSVKVSYTIQSTQSSGFNYIILIVLALAIAAGIFFYLNRKLKANKKEKSKLDVIKQVLNDKDNLILDKLKELGKVKSSYLRKMCDMPKASFSRHIQELEKKGLIKRSGDGRNKFIELKE